MEDWWFATTTQASGLFSRSVSPLTLSIQKYWSQPLAAALFETSLKDLEFWFQGLRWSLSSSLPYHLPVEPKETRERNHQLGSQDRIGDAARSRKGERNHQEAHECQPQVVNTELGNRNTVYLALLFGACRFCQTLKRNLNQGCVS